MSDIDTLVIIPTYNEKENINQIAAAVLDASPHADMLFVDDNSPDGTGRMADALAEKHERVHVLHRTSKDGLGRAYLAGFKWALERDYRFVMEMDCDFSHDPNEIPNFRDSVIGGNDLVLGSRYVGGIRIMNWPLSRLMLSRGAGIYVQLITGMPFTDPTGGFKCFRREVARDVFAIQKIDGWAFDVEILHIALRHGYRVIEVPIRWYYGEGSRISAVRDSWSMLLEVLRIRRNGHAGLYDK